MQPEFHIHTSSGRNISLRLVLLVAFAFITIVGYAQTTSDFSNGQFTTVLDGPNVSMKASSNFVVGAVTIPDTVENAVTTHTVTAIPPQAFYAKTNITSLTFAEGSKVATIVLAAFLACQRGGVHHSF